MVTRLEREVWGLGSCAGCGLCVAACSKQVLHWQDGEHPEVEKRTKTVGYTKGPLDTCTFCEKFCEEVCPRLERWTPWETLTTLVARSRGPVRTGAPNGVIQSILIAGRSAGLLDGVVILDLDPWELNPVARVVSTVEEIAGSVGTQYLWAPTLDALNEAIFDWKMENMAVVSTPCIAQAIRKLRRSTNPRLKPYQDAIRLTVAVFCTGIYKGDLIEDVLVNRMGVSRNLVKRLEVSHDREWLRAVLWDGSVRTIPRQQAESYTRSGCGGCEDYLGESADLAVGALGAPDEHATLITRSQIGDVFVRNAIQMNLLETSEGVDLEALAAAADEKDRRVRSQAFKDLRILMLDALADPRKRGEAVQQFACLYRTPTSSRPREIVRNHCTGC